MKKICLLFLLALLPLLASADAVEIKGIYYNLDATTQDAEVAQSPYYSYYYKGDIVIPKTVTYKGITYDVTSIRESAFMGCTGLTSVSIPNSVTSIGRAAFRQCEKLTSVNIPSGVTTIRWGTFSLCQSLTSVVIPNTVTTIEEYAFAATGLTSIVIPNSVTTIGEDAFYGCQSLTSLVLPNGLTTISKSSFFACQSLTSLTIPNTVTTIEPFAFACCTALPSLTIPNSVEEIGDNAFSACASATTVTLGSGVIVIGAEAFSQCYQLKDFYCLAKCEPDAADDVFNETYIENATLYVPLGSVNRYKEAEPWSGFGQKKAITLTLNKTKANLEKGKTLTLKATLLFSDKTVTWKSSNTRVATVTSSGKVSGLMAGTATITCTSQATGLKGSCKVTVGYVSLDKTEAVIEKGKTVTLTPTVYPTSLSDQSVTWTSSDTKVATVTSAGKVKGVKYGTATITCTSNATGLSTTCQVSVVGVTLSKTAMSVKKGQTVPLKATVYPSEEGVTWKSSNTKVATVTSSGKVKGIKAGTATITCTSNATGLKATCKVTVGYVSLSESEITIKKGKTKTLTATVYPSSLSDRSVMWESSDKEVATVTSSGKVKGISAGTAVIICTSYTTGLSSVCIVNVTATSSTRSLDGDEDDEVTGIERMEILEEAPAISEPYDVYDLRGQKVLQRVTSLDGLPVGIYIVNGRKVLKR